MAKVFIFFAAQRTYKHFSMPHIGDVDSMLEVNYLNLKDRTRYHSFCSNGIFGCGYPTESDDWCTTNFEIVNISIDNHTVDFNKLGIHCIEIASGIKKVNVEVKLRSIKDPSYFLGSKTLYEKFDDSYKHLTLSFLTHIDEGNNYIYALLSYKVKYVLHKTSEKIEYAEKTYNRYRNYAMDFNIIANKISGDQFRKTIIEHGIYINKTIVPQKDNSSKLLIPWNSNEKINVVKTETVAKKVDNTVTLNVNSNVNNKPNIEKISKQDTTTTKLIITPNVPQKPLKYHETVEFKKEMEPYHYEIKDDEVILIKIKNPQAKMIIPNCVNIIKDEAFGYYLSSFQEKIKEVYIPNSVIKIGKGLFKNNAYIEKVTIDAPVRTIPEETFYCAVSLKEVKLPKTIKKIEKNAFVELNTNRVDGPKNVEIHKEAFSEGIYYYVDGLKQETPKETIKLIIDKPQVIPYSQRVKVESTGNPEIIRLNNEIEKIQNQLDSIRKEVYAPTDEFEIEKITLNEKISSLNSKVDKLNKEISKYKKLINEFKSQNRTEYRKTIIEKDGVMIGIAPGSKEIFIPNTIKKIDLDKYYDIDTVVFEKGSKLENFEDIKWFKNVKYLVLPDCFKEIKFGLLYPFTSVLYIYVPLSYKLIYKDFQYMQSLTYLEFERNELDYNNPLRLLDNGLSELKALKGIILPYGVEKILEFTFSKCDSLEDIIMPNYVASIDLRAFNFCTSLKYLNFAQKNYNHNFNKQVKESVYKANEELQIYANKTFVFQKSQNVNIFNDQEEEQYVDDKERQLQDLKEKIKNFRGSFINNIFKEEER